MVFFVDSHESVHSFVTINSNAGKLFGLIGERKLKTTRDKKNEGEDKMEKSKIPST
jgi:hypothetical protein